MFSPTSRRSEICLYLFLFIDQECGELKERLLEVQTRSMKDYLLFGGIPGTSSDENTEEMVKHFIKNELEVDDDITFQIVHRLRQRTDCRSRSIVAKFERRRDRERVLKTAPLKLINKRQNVSKGIPQSDVLLRRKESCVKVSLRGDGGRKRRSVEVQPSDTDRADIDN
ncbi:hypothetical protein ScPMuIL_018876 [Solemya velum]